MIAAIILAAGQSRRMGQPKMLLPWGRSTVIEHVITVFLRAGIEDIVVITGGTRAEVEKATGHYPIRRVHNDDYDRGEMLSSLQRGLRAMKEETAAALVALGDQPQVEELTVRLVTEAYRATHSQLVVPSFKMRRGHPWLVGRSLWEELRSLAPPESARSFLNRHATEIHYVEVGTSSVLADLDTPQDYARFRPL